MLIILQKNWWSLILRGLAAIFLGAIAMARPGISVGSLTHFFFAYALIDGLVGIAGAIRAAESDQHGTSLLAEGLAGVGAGIVTISWAASFVELAYAIAAWALLTGAFEMTTAWQLRRNVTGEWLVASSAIASLLLGVLMIVLPLAGPPPVAAGLGIYSIVFGALLVALGLRLQPRRRVSATVQR